MLIQKHLINYLLETFSSFFPLEVREERILLADEMNALEAFDTNEFVVDDGFSSPSTLISSVGLVSELVSDLSLTSEMVGIAEEFSAVDDKMEVKPVAAMLPLVFTAADAPDATVLAATGCVFSDVRVTNFLIAERRP